MKTFGDLQKLEKLIRGSTTYQVEANSHQLRPRGIGIGLQILRDVPVMAPIVDESELEYRCVNAVKGENVFVSKSLPDRCQFPKDLLCFLEVLRGVDTKSFEGHLLVVPDPSPDIGRPA